MVSSGLATQIKEQLKTPSSHNSYQSIRKISIIVRNEMQFFFFISSLC